MNDNIALLDSKLKEIKKKGWIKCKNKNINIAGLTLEKMLGINPENFEIPDYNGIEIKTKSSNREEYITLFSATPDSYLFEIKRLYENYSYPDKKDSDYNILNFSVSANYWTHINGLYNARLHIDSNERKVILQIYDSKYKLIDENSSWTFDLLEEKLYRKLKLLCFVEVDKTLSAGQLYIKYKNYIFYKLKDFETFINLLNNGVIRISFCIGIYKSGRRIGQIHDHGTKFSIKKDKLNLLFDEISPEWDQEKNRT